MKIVDNNILNTGGGCMIWELTIENGGELKAIGINEEGIVGYKTPFDENQGDADIQFVAMDAKELRMILPEDIAVACIRYYLMYLARFRIDNHLKIFELCSCGCKNIVPSPPYESGGKLYASAYCILLEAKCCSYCGGSYDKDFVQTEYNFPCRCNFAALDQD